MSMAEAGRGGGFKGAAGHIGASAFRGGNVHVGGGSLAKLHTNPGGKYVGGSVGKFHTNPGGKYVYRGSGSKFRTNPGGKYAYRGWSGKYDNHHHYGHYRRYGDHPVWPPALFIWRRVRLSLPARRGDGQRLLVGSVPGVQRRLLGLLLPALDSEDPEGRIFVADLAGLRAHLRRWAD